MHADVLRRAGYKIHQDNEVLADGTCSSSRAYTAILYCNDPAWPDAQGGHLVIYPGRRASDDKPSAGGVAVAPRGGRLVVFDSFLWHEVRPATVPGYALTNWITRAAPA